MFVISFPPLAMAECGFRGEFGFIPTTYGTKTRLGNWSGSTWKWNTPDIGFLPRR